MSSITKLRKALVEIPNEVRRFTGGQYPSFVLERDPAPPMDRVPVFVLHTVEERTLAAQLEFLSSNGYRTLRLAELMAFLAGDLTLSRPSVVLTLDDGDRSWYHVAYPLLAKYGYSAAGFLVTSRILESPGPPDSRGWLSWQQVLEMERSGVIEFESHGHFHDRVFVGPELIDFYHPEYPVDSLRLGIPWTKLGGVYTNDLPFGMPLYRTAPTMRGELRYIEDEELRDECVRFVRTNGGEAFFRRKWRPELNAHYQSLSAQRGPAGRYESAEERRERLLSVLRESKRTLEERLDKEVRHFCYPWGAGSDLSVTLSRDLGYASNFWTSLPDRADNAAGDSPFYIARMKDDFIRRLPGKGRISLGALLAAKAARRLRKADIY